MEQLTRKLNVTLTLILLVLLSHSQSLQITPLAGYTFGARFDVYGGSGKLNDGATYGGTMSYRLQNNVEIETSYSFMNTTGEAYSNFWIFSVYDEPITIHQIMLGGNKVHSLTEQIDFFAGLKFGLIQIVPKNYMQHSYFNTNIDLGIRHYVNSFLGIQLQANLNFPITGIGGQLWWSSAGGTQVGVSSYSPFAQFGFKAGLIFRLINK
jgi:hypothetical protein